MFAFEGFTPFNFSEGVPYVSVTKNGITFNKGVILKLGCPQYVVLLINAVSRQIAIQACSEKTPNATVFYNDEKKKNAFSVRWNGKDLMNTLTTMTGWDVSQKGYRVEGLLIPEERAMLFDFDDYELIE